MFHLPTSVIDAVMMVLSLLPGLVAKEVNEAELSKVVVAAEMGLPLTASFHDRFAAAVHAIVADEANIFIDPTYSALAIRFLNWFVAFVKL